MSEAIRVLYVDDYPLDRELVRDALEKEEGGFRVSEATSRADFEARLAEGDYDLVLSDFNILGFEGLQVIEAVHAKNPLIPVIIVTGTGSEEVAVQALKRGAVDYVIKSPKHIRRLPQTIRSAIENKRLGDERDRLFNYSLDPLCIAGFDGYFKQLNPAWEKTLGWSEVELLSRPYVDFVHPDDRAATSKAAGELLGGNNVPVFETRCRCKDGTYKWLSWNAYSLPEQKLIFVVARDITERKRAQERIENHLRYLSALNTIEMAIVGSSHVIFTLEIVLDQITIQLGVDAAAVLLYSPHLNTLEYAAGRGFRGGKLSNLTIQMGEDYAGRAALERRVVSVANLSATTGPFAEAALAAKENFVACHAVPLVAKGHVKGVLELFQRTPFEPNADWLDLMKTIAGQAAIAVESAQMFEDLQRSNLELVRAYDATLEGWSQAMDLRDKETEGHSSRVAEMTLRLARALGVRDEELVQIRRGALLHDIGKLGVPDSILLRPESLSEEEWKIMRFHPTYAHKMLSSIAFLRSALDIPYCHHEKWDGTGYPRGLTGEEIPLSARIFAVVDVWDALSSDRPYRKAWPPLRVREYIRSQAGEHFDPSIVPVFLDAVGSE